jgi:hypothetical protein
MRDRRVDHLMGKESPIIGRTPRGSQTISYTAGGLPVAIGDRGERASLSGKAAQYENALRQGTSLQAAEKLRSSGMFDRADL